MKPDIVFFGQGLPDSFHQQLEEDKNHGWCFSLSPPPPPHILTSSQADLLIVMGSSLKVPPCPH